MEEMGFRNKTKRSVIEIDMALSNNKENGTLIAKLPY